MLTRKRNVMGIVPTRESPCMEFRARFFGHTRTRASQMADPSALRPKLYMCMQAHYDPVTVATAAEGTGCAVRVAPRILCCKCAGRALVLIPGPHPRHTQSHPQSQATGQSSYTGLD